MDSSSCPSCRQGSQKNGECGLKHLGNGGPASPREFGFNRVDSWVSCWFCHSGFFIVVFIFISIFFLIFFAKWPLSLEFLWSKARQAIISWCSVLLHKVLGQSWPHQLHCYLVSPSLSFFICKSKGLYCLFRVSWDLNGFRHLQAPNSQQTVLVDSFFLIGYTPPLL